jgi:hypothetical protein
MKSLAVTHGAVFFVLLFGAAIAVNADVIQMETTAYPGGVANGWSQGFSLTAEVDRTINVNSSGFDELQVMLDSFTGPAAGSQMVDMQGTWSITGSPGFELVSDAAVAAYDAANSTTNTWGSYTLAPGIPAAPGTGYGQSTTLVSRLGFDDALPCQACWTRSGSGELFSSFTGVWYSLPGSFLSPGELLADLYVPTGWQPSASNVLMFQGALGFTYGYGTTENAQLNTFVSDPPDPPTPEPTTLVLLVGTGLVSLLAFAWRKRAGAAAGLAR